MSQEQNIKFNNQNKKKLFLAHRGLLVLIFASISVLWAYLWRTPIWSRDDAYFASRSGMPRGGVGWSSFWDATVQDVMERNGRTADLWGQLIFSTGSMIGPIMTVLMVLFSVTFYLAAVTLISSYRQTRVSPLLKISIAVVAAAMPFMLVLWVPRIAGSTYMFMSATVGYVGGGVMIWALMFFLFRKFPKFNYRLPEAVGLVLLGLLTAMHHEVLALMLLGVISAVLIAVRHASKSGLFVLISISLVSLVRFAVPGMWARREVLQTIIEIEGAGPIFTHAALGLRVVAHMTEIVGPIIIAFMVALILFFFSVASAPGSSMPGVVRIIVEVGLALSTWAMIVIGRRLEAWKPNNYFHGPANRALYTSTHAQVMFLILAVILLLLFVAIFWPGQLKSMWLALTMLALIVGSALIPMYMGSLGDRPNFFAITMMIFAATVMIGVSLDLLLERFSLIFENVNISRLVINTLIGLITVVVAVHGVQGAQEIVRNVDRNIATWNVTLRQIEQAKKDTSQIVEIPAELPAPDFSCDYLGLGDFSVAFVKLYYDLDPSVTVVRK